MPVLGKDKCDMETTTGSHNSEWKHNDGVLQAVKLN
jgi:hypothetical protein